MEISGKRLEKLMWGRNQRLRSRPFKVKLVNPALETS